MQSLYILLAIIVGVLLPYGHEYTWIFRPNLMVMLFFSFLGVQFSREIIKKNHGVILGLNLILPLVLLGIFSLIDRTAALAVFTIAIAPTAAAAPVLTDFFKKDISYVTASVLVTSPVIAIVLPLLLPMVVDMEGEIAVTEILSAILTLVFIPLILSFIVKKGVPKVAKYLLKFKSIGFYLFIVNVYIASANSWTFLTTNEEASFNTVALIALFAAITCVLQFQIGAYIGKPHYAIESSLSLGRKNTLFALWVGLTFISPIVALGPMFYILFQNLYNTGQLLRIERRAKEF